MTLSHRLKRKSEGKFEIFILDRNNLSSIQKKRQVTFKEQKSSLRNGQKIF